MQIICDALLDFVPFLQFLKHEKRLWRSVTFSKVADLNPLKQKTFGFLMFSRDMSRQDFFKLTLIHERF